MNRSIYQRLLETIKTTFDQARSVAISENPHWERLLEATAVLATRCQEQLLRNQHSLDQRFIDAAFPQMYATIPSGVILQANSSRPETLRKKTQLTISDRERKVPFELTADVSILPTPNEKMEIQTDTEPLRICLHITPTPMAITQIRLYLPHQSSANFLYDCILRQRVTVRINDQPGRIEIDGQAWLEYAGDGFESNVLPLKTLGNFPEALQFIALFFPAQSVHSITFEFLEPWPHPIPTPLFRFNCVPSINLATTRTIPLPARPEIPCLLEQADARIVLLEQVLAIVAATGQGSPLARDQYWLQRHGPEVYLRLINPKENHLISAQVRYCAFNTLSRHIETHTIELDEPSSINVSQASALSPCWQPSPTDLANVMHGYTAILHGRLDVSVVRNLLTSLQLTRFANELYSYTTKPAHVFQRGVVRHYTEHHITINNQQPAYQYAMFCYTLHQLVDSLTDKAVLICDFTNGDCVRYE